MNRNKVLLCGFFVLSFIFIICMGPMDIFSHGFFSNVVAYDQIGAEGFLEYVNLGEKDFEEEFMPLKRHFAGFQINLVNISEGNTGELLLEIFNDKDKLIEKVEVDISKVRAGEWYKVYTKKNLKVNRVYTLRISANNCQTPPYLQIVDEDYLGEENISGNLLLGYAYAESTFVLPEKILITFFIGSICLFLLSSVDKKKKRRDKCKLASIYIFLLSVLAWNYIFNSMDNENTTFSGFQADSETLVSGVIKAEQEGVTLTPFGLGRYMNPLGVLNTYNLEFQTDSSWSNGYSKEKPQILIDDNEYTEEVAIPGNYIQFGNDDVLRINHVECIDNKRVVFLDANDALSESKYGSLEKIKFMEADSVGIVQQPGKLKAYNSQFGLQGKVFRHLSRYISQENSIFYLNFLCSLLTAAVLIGIVFLICFKYNILLAVCFYATFWLSPWIINYARNLYWVEFTWFIPMLIGLYCFRHIDSIKTRYLSYLLIWIAITGKCLCGYEYLSTIMLAMIAFPLVDLIDSMIKKDKSRSFLILRTIFIMGVVAIIGFMTALCIHAGLRGENLSEGIRSIFEQDVLRRTSGGDLNEFSEIFWGSFNASYWEVLKKYFHFNTDIITGIQGSLFPLLCILPLLILGQGVYKKKENWTDISLYIVFFLTSISWFILAKSHSSIHIHLNFVMWYFGFIQICFYIIIKWIIMQVRNK